MECRTRSSIGVASSALEGTAAEPQESGLVSRRSVKRLQFVSEPFQKIRGFKALRLKLLSEAQASISVPSTVKCSSLVSLSSRASATTVRKNSPATSCSSNAPDCG